MSLCALPARQHSTIIGCELLHGSLGLCLILREMKQHCPITQEKRRKKKAPRTDLHFEFVYLLIGIRQVVFA